MVNLQKASLLTNGNQVTVMMPISKIDAEKRIVSGFATLDNVDKQGDRVLPEASDKAFSNFRGNIRLMHQPIPAGKMVSFKSDTFYDPETQKSYNGVFVDAYISKGADSIWEMVLDGTLTGFSIGGNVREADTEYDPELEKTVRVIKEYDLVELSLVDSPANQLANIFSIQKTIDGEVASGIFNKSNIQNVFWCENEEIAYLSQDEKYSCSSCSADLKSIGWIDEIEKADIEKAMSKVIDVFKKADNPGTVTSEDTINRYPDQNKLKAKTQPKNGKNKQNSTNHSVGDYVVVSANGKTFKGKVTKVITNGKIKDTTSNKSVEASQDSPQYIVSVYEENKGVWKATAKRVASTGSCMKTWKLKKSNSNTEVSLPNTVVNKANDTEESVATQINEGGVEMAENTEVAEDVVVDEVVEEVVEVEAAEEVAEVATEESLEKSDEVEETTEETVETSADTEDPAEDASTDNGEATDLEKTLSEIKDFVGDALTKSTDANTEAISNVASTVAEVTKALTDKIVENDSRLEEINKGLAEIVNAVTSMNNRLESVENDTAVKKSGEYENSPETTIQKSSSVWGGRFLGSAQYLN